MHQVVRQLVKVLQQDGDDLLQAGLDACPLLVALSVIGAIRGPSLFKLLAVGEEVVQGAHDQIDGLDLEVVLSIFDLVDLIAEERAQRAPDRVLVLLNHLEEWIRLLLESVELPLVDLRVVVEVVDVFDKTFSDVLQDESYYVLHILVIEDSRKDLNGLLDAEVLLALLAVRLVLVDLVAALVFVALEDAFVGLDAALDGWIGLQHVVFNVV